MPYIGNNHIAGDHTNNFKVLDDISSYTATFDGSASSVVDTTNNTIRVVEHRFIQGQRVTYTNGGGGNIGGLTTGTAYFVIFDTASTFKLATSASNAANSTAINLSSVGSGNSHTLNAAFDGVNTKFKLTHGSGTGARLNNATQINIAINNVVQRPNLDPNNFTDGFALEDNHKIVFQTAPTSEDIFWGSIIANTLTTFDISDHKIDTFTGDGSTTEFTLSHTPANNESLMVTINGVLQHPSNASTARAYTLIASIIQFTAAPGVGDEIQVRHIGFAGATTADVSGFYGRTGNVVLTDQDDIIVNKINVGTGVTIESNGQATFVGVVTFGSGSTTIDNNVVNVGTALTLGHTQGLQFHTQNLHSAGFEVNQINASGIITASSLDVGGNAFIGGVLTYEDVTSIDSVGIITAQKDIHVGAGVSVVGIVTAATFKGDGDFVDIDVDGHTNLDNVSVVGVSTFTRVGATAVFNSGAANDGRLEFQYNNSRIGLLAYHSDRLEIQTDSSKDFTIRTNGANERVRIDSNGRVGLGITNPDAYFASYNRVVMGRPNDSGSMTIVSAPTFGGYIAFADGTSGNQAYRGLITYAHAQDEMIFSTGAVARLRIKNNGNVGIATTNAQDLLHIGGGSNTNLRFTGNQIKFFRDDGASYIDQYGDGDIVLRTTPSGSQVERLRITSVGKIGMNIASPYADVDIESSVEDANNGTLSNHGIRLSHAGATDEEVIPITAGFLSNQDRARAGIGFISKVSGSSEGYAGAIGFYTRNTADGNGLYRTDERVRIAEDGKFGIGTNSPGSLFQVGTDASGKLTFDGANTLAITGPEGGAARIDLIADQGDDAGDKWRIANTSGNLFKIQRTTSHTDALSIDTSGNITAVNTTSGATTGVTLKVGASAASGTNSGTIIINNGGQGNASLQFDYENHAARAKIYTHSSTNDIIFDTSGTEAFRIFDGGNIRQQKASANPNFTLSRNASIGNDNQTIATIDFASNTAHTVQARLMGKNHGTNNVGGYLVFETRQEGGSLTEKFRLNGDGQTLLTRGTVGGQESIGNVNDTWWKIGTWAGPGVDAAARATITVLGANTHNSGNPAGGETKIYLSITGSAVHASFYSHTDHHQGVIGVAHKYDSSASSCEIWVKYSAGYSSTSSFADVTNGYFTGASVNTGSSSTPSGATLATAKYVVRTSNGTTSSERLLIDASGRIGMSNDSSSMPDPSTSHANADELTLGAATGSVRAGMTINSGANLDGSIHFGDPDSNVSGQINYDHNGDHMRLYTASNVRLDLSASGAIVKNASGKMMDLRTTASTGSCWLQLSDNSGNQKGYFGFGSGSNETLYIVQQESADIAVYTGSSIKWKFTTGGSFEPGANDSYDIGSSGNVVRNIYTGDLHLNNLSKEKGNDVDGTNGSWTIQEGQDDLYIINKLNGKKYRIPLEEVN